MILPDWHREFDTMDTLGFNLYMRSTPTKVSTVSGPQVVIVAPPKIYEDEVRPYPDGPLPSLNYLAEPEYSPRRFSAIKEYPGSKFELFVGSIAYGVPGAPGREDEEFYTPPARQTLEEILAYFNKTVDDYTAEQIVNMRAKLEARYLADPNPIPLGPNANPLDLTNGWDDENIEEPFNKFLANQFVVLYRRPISKTGWMLEINDWSGSSQELLDADVRYNY